MYPTRTDNIVAYAKGPAGPAGEVTQAEIDALIDGAPADGNTLKKLYDSKAPLDGAALTNATTTTQAPGNNSTKLATTAFVHQEVINSAAASKAYADGLIAAADAMVFKGVIDCSTNPNYPTADRGWTYRVSVAGKIGGAAGVAVEAGDIAICTTDGTLAGDQATVGSAWGVIQSNIDGAVTLTGAQTLANKTLTAPAINSPTGIVVEDLGGAEWQTWTPTFTMSTVGGTPITTALSGNGARYKQVGNVAFWSLDVTITDIGSGNTGAFIFSNPLPAVNGNVVYGGSGKEVITLAKLVSIGNWSDTQQSIAMADGTGTLSGGNGTRFQVSGFYEAA